MSNILDNFRLLFNCMEVKFKERLVELRKENKLTQQDLATKLNTTQRRISHLEKGNAEPDIATLLRLAEIFNVSTDFLLGKTDF